MLFFYYSGCLSAREQYILTVENFNFALLLVLWLNLLGLYVCLIS